MPSFINIISANFVTRSFILFCSNIIFPFQPINLVVKFLLVSIILFHDHYTIHYQYHSNNLSLSSAQIFPSAFSFTIYQWISSFLNFHWFSLPNAILQVLHWWLRVHVFKRFCISQIATISALAFSHFSFCFPFKRKKTTTTAVPLFPKILLSVKLWILNNFFFYNYFHFIFVSFLYTLWLNLMKSNFLILHFIHQNLLFNLMKRLKNNHFWKFSCIVISRAPSVIIALMFLSYCMIILEVIRNKQ